MTVRVRPALDAAVLSLRSFRRRTLVFAAAAAVALLLAVLALSGLISGPDLAAMSGFSDEETAAALRDARGELVSGDADAAGRIYRDLSVAKPLDANVRMLLAIHLQDIDKDPFGALSEFRAFLRLAPESEKAELARERIHACELEIARRVNPADVAAGESAEEAAPPDEAAVAKLAEELSAARADAASAREALAAAESDRDQLKRTNANLQKQIDVLKGSGTSARAPRDDLTDRFDRLSENGGAVQTGPSVRFSDYMTYEVKRGDTLWKIAQKAYNDGSRTAEIKAANPGLVGADGSVREGTILRIPR